MKVLLLALAILLGVFLRFFLLGQIPPSLDWDEASLGWNAYSFFKTGTDEFGLPHPVSIRSFNDFKPPLYVYLSVPFMALGLTEFSVRLLSAIAGVLTLVTTFALVNSLTKSFKLSLLTTFLLAISPWSIQFSRAAFESNLSLLFTVLGGLCLALYINRSRLPFLLAAGVSFGLSIYSYHSSRIFVPVFLLLIGLFYFPFFKKRLIPLLSVSLIAFVLLLPILRNAVRVGGLQARWNTVSVFANPPSLPYSDNPPLFYATTIAKNYLTHFNFDFLFLTADNNPRHHAPGMGLLYLFEFPFLLLGLFALLKYRPPWARFLIAWLLAAPVASSLTTDTPHAVRALLFLPSLQLLVAVGLLVFLKPGTLPLRLKFLAILVLLPLNIFYFLHQYFVHMPFEAAPAWQYGYREVVREVLVRESNFEKVVVTTAYDQPYIYFLFYGRIAPTIKNNGYFYATLDKYQFLDTKSLLPSDLNPNTLYVLSGKENLPSLVTIKEIYFPNKAVAFRLATLVE